jgi:DNA-binding XRE family transcriptional regulator
MILVQTIAVLEQLPELLHRERQRRGISKTRAAEEIGISLSTLERIEGRVRRRRAPGGRTAGTSLDAAICVLRWLEAGG